MSKSDAFANYASVLKQLKRANDILITITSVTPVNAQKAIDIDTDSTWRIRRETESTGTSTTKSPADTAPASKSKTFGSGMVFTRDGHIFTNHHVIGKSTNVFIVVYENGQLTSKLPAMIVSKDPRSDLAILQCKEWKPPVGAPASPPPLVSSSQCKLGAQVFVLGYPLPGTVSSNVKYTKGDVSDMSGLDDDSSKIQHTAQIQPGNSGGPMALMDGRVVGIVVSSLSEAYAMKTSGALPQGVNFSIKSDYLLTQASIAGIEVPKGIPSNEPVDHVKAYTVQIMCEM
jgi:S1-C subfamily serine protease